MQASRNPADLLFSPIGSITSNHMKQSFVNVYRGEGSHSSPTLRRSLREMRSDAKKK